MSINFNCKILPSEQPIFTASNRAFRYGDGLFETIRVFDGKIPFFQRHFQRLIVGCRLLNLDVPGHFTQDFFENEISKLLVGGANYRVRLTVWRSGGGLYTPETNLPDFLIEAKELPSSVFELNNLGLEVSIFQKYLLPQTMSQSDTSFPSVPLPIKSSAALLQVLAAIAKQEAGTDDSLMLNTAGRLACGTSSNIFLVKNGELLTPALSEGCVVGTMRATLLDLAEHLGIRCSESEIHPNELFLADEIFLTNAIQGIRWVGKLEATQKTFGNLMAEILVHELNSRFLGK